VLAVNADGEPAIVKAAAGDGTVLAFGTFPGQPAGPERSAALERLLERELAGAGIAARFRLDPADGEELHWRTGTDGRGNRLLFILTRAADTAVTVRAGDGWRGPAAPAADLAGGGTWQVTGGPGGPGWTGRTGPDGVAVLAWREAE
jgi:hypothetical protein